MNKIDEIALRVEREVDALQGIADRTFDALNSNSSAYYVGLKNSMERSLLALAAFKGM